MAREETIENFRRETRQWLVENCPLAMRSLCTEDEIPGGGTKQLISNPDAKLWLDRMAAKGWTAPQWPKEYGGGGLDKQSALVLQQEMARIDARQPISGMGFSMIGPTLLDYGTEAQKLEHLPKIVSGEIRWCQGYSEPGAGSDLASLQAKCIDQGDVYTVNGQKVWTSGAQYSDWIYTLVRTDFEASKHDGISFVLIDMNQPGVTVKPITLINGLAPFCETFFDDAKVEKHNLLGQLNRGWSVGKRLLQHERSSISGLSGGGLKNRYDVLGKLSDVAKQSIGLSEGKLANLNLRNDISQNEMDQRCFELTQKRAMAESQSGGTPTFATSMFKYYSAEMGKARLELHLLTLGNQGLGWGGEGFSDVETTFTQTWLRSKASSIAGGTSEIQMNIIAKRVLGLPD